MKCAGYRLKGYDATYERATFDIRKGQEDSKSRVLIVEDLESGIQFIIEFDKKKTPCNIC